MSVAAIEKPEIFRMFHGSTEKLFVSQNKTVKNGEDHQCSYIYKILIWFLNSNLVTQSFTDRQVF